MSIIDLSELHGIFCCPDDKSNLTLTDNNLFTCNKCDRKFQIINNMIDFRPKSRFEINQYGIIENNYNEYYDSLLNNGSPGSEGTFGLKFHSVSEGFVHETRQKISKYIKKNYVVCDVGAGSGDYSIFLSKHCKILFHCDLDITGLKLSQINAQSMSCNNIFFIICDYFNLPFKNHCIDFVYTIDVLERGKEHDSKVLKEISRIASKNGFLAFDFHSSERSKLTKIFPEMTTYSKNEIIEMTRMLLIDCIDIIGTGFIPQIKKWSKPQYLILNSIAKLLKFPPGRWLVLGQIIEEI